MRTEEAIKGLVAQRQRAEKFLQEIDLPEDFVPMAIVVGFDMVFLVSFFPKPLPDGERTSYDVWSAENRLRFEAQDGRFNATALAAAATMRWSGVRVYDGRCSCCTVLSEVSEFNMLVYKTGKDPTPEEWEDEKSRRA